MDKFSYGLGMGIGQNLLSMGVKDMNVEDFVKGLKDVLSGAKTEISHSEAQTVVNDHFRKLAEEAYELNKASGESFLAENAKKEGVTVLPSGLQYEVIAAFRDRVYFSYEMVFKFYQFVDAIDEADLKRAEQAYKEKAYYDTGFELEMDDNLITLVTCDHYQDYGRFVVIAREITEDEA